MPNQVSYVDNMSTVFFSLRKDLSQESRYMLYIPLISTFFSYVSTGQVVQNHLFLADKETTPRTFNGRSGCSVAYVDGFVARFVVSGTCFLGYLYRSSLAIRGW